MISILDFGEWVRLGNQFFQFGLMFAINKDKKYSISLPKGKNRKGKDIQFWKCFDIQNINIHNFKKDDFTCCIKEKNGCCNFDEDILQQEDNSIFDGYFQSYRYFDKYKKELIECLKFKNNIIEKGNYILSKYKTPLTSIHVRRTDYLKDNLYGDLIKEGYYEKAIENINENEEVLVFSDDVNFVKDYFKNKKNFNIIEEDEYISLYMMTKCERHIIANSSFSWMGAYLSGKENITCPNPWLPSSFPKPNNIQKDIIKPEWKKINVFN
jgi:hypothetical protein